MVVLESNGNDPIRVGLLQHPADNEFRGLLRIETTGHYGFQLIFIGRPDGGFMGYLCQGIGYQYDGNGMANRTVFDNFPTIHMLAGSLRCASIIPVISP